MSGSAPVIFEWDGDVMVPLPRFRKIADSSFVVHEQYRMVVQEERSFASHRQYFASLHEAWTQLPEDEALRFPTVDHLRAWCLIKAGFYDQRSIVAKSHTQALQIASFLKPMDEFAVVVVQEATVLVCTAKSQSTRAMGKKDFGVSKDAVLEVAWGMVGLSVAEATPNVGKAA